MICCPEVEKIKMNIQCVFLCGLYTSIGVFKNILIVMSTLDYFFWCYIMPEIFRSKPSTIDALKAIVQEFILSIDPDIIRKSWSSTRTRYEIVILEKGGIKKIF